MNKTCFLLSLFLLSFLASVAAECSGNQVDINSASLTELDKLYGIGPVKAQAIVDSRPFGSVDDLIDVNGIGEATLNGIKSQGLACIGEEVDVEEKPIKENTTIEKPVTNIQDIKPQTENTTMDLDTITLDSNTQSIKSGENSQVSDKNDGQSYAIYGLFAFAAVLGLLFLGKKVIERRKEKK